MKLNLGFEKVKSVLQDINCDTKKARTEFRKRIKQELLNDKTKSALADVAEYNGSILSDAAKVIAGIDPDKKKSNSI